MIPAWQQAEAEHDLIREHERANRLKERRERRFWPPIVVALILAAYTAIGLIENGYIHV